MAKYQQQHDELTALIKFWPLSKLSPLCHLLLVGLILANSGVGGSQRQQQVVASQAASSPIIGRRLSYIDNKLKSSEEMRNETLLSTQRTRSNQSVRQFLEARVFKQSKSQSSLIPMDEQSFADYKCAQYCSCSLIQVMSQDKLENRVNLTKVQCNSGQFNDVLTIDRRTQIIHISLPFSASKQQPSLFQQANEDSLAKHGIKVAEIDGQLLATNNLATQSAASDSFRMPRLNQFNLLREIVIINLRFEVCDSQVFKRGQKLRRLQWNHNRLRHISKFCFRHLEQLIELNLDNNELEELESALFSDLMSLKSLSIAQNRLFELAAHQFANLTELVSLNLAGNSFKSINLHLLEPMQNSLRLLALANNQIKSFVYTYISQQQQQQLFVSNSSVLARTNSSMQPKISSTSNGSTKSNANVTLPMSTLQMSPFSGAMFKSLLKLNVDGNQLERIKSLSLHRFYNVKFLSIRRNNLATIRDRAFNGLRLIELNLASNKLQSISKCAFCNSTIKRLILAQNNVSISLPNQLSAIDSPLPVVAALSGVNNNNNDNNNNIVKETIISPLSSASERQAASSAERGPIGHTLDLPTVASSASMLILSQSILGPLFAQLEYLDLSGNEQLANQLEALLEPLLELQYLNLASVGLERSLPAPSLFKNLRHLKYLNLSHNQLDQINSDTIEPLGELELLDLSYNKFSEIDESFLVTLDELPQLKLIILASNPWYCSQCKISPIYDWILRSSIYNNTCIMAQSFAKGENSGQLDSGAENSMGDPFEANADEEEDGNGDEEDLLDNEDGANADGQANISSQALNEERPLADQMDAKLTTTYRSAIVRNSPRDSPNLVATNLVRDDHGDLGVGGALAPIMDSNQYHLAGANVGKLQGYLSARGPQSRQDYGSIVDLARQQQLHYATSQPKMDQPSDTDLIFLNREQLASHRSRSNGAKNQASFSAARLAQLDTDPSLALKQRHSVTRSLQMIAIDDDDPSVGETMASLIIGSQIHSIGGETNRPPSLALIEALRQFAIADFCLKCEFPSELRSYNIHDLSPNDFKYCAGSAPRFAASEPKIGLTLAIVIIGALFCIIIVVIVMYRKKSNAYYPNEDPMESHLDAGVGGVARSGKNPVLSVSSDIEHQYGDATDYSSPPRSQSFDSFSPADENVDDDGANEDEDEEEDDYDDDDEEEEEEEDYDEDEQEEEEEDDDEDDGASRNHGPGDELSDVGENEDHTEPGQSLANKQEPKKTSAGGLPTMATSPAAGLRPASGVQHLAADSAMTSSVGKHLDETETPKQSGQHHGEQSDVAYGGSVSRQPRQLDAKQPSSGHQLSQMNDSVGPTSAPVRLDTKNQARIGQTSTMVSGRQVPPSGASETNLTQAPAPSRATDFGSSSMKRRQTSLTKTDSPGPLAGPIGAHDVPALDANQSLPNNNGQQSKVAQLTEFAGGRKVGSKPSAASENLQQPASLSASDLLATLEPKNTSIDMQSPEGLITTANTTPSGPFSDPLGPQQHHATKLVQVASVAGSLHGSQSRARARQSESRKKRHNHANVAHPAAPVHQIPDSGSKGQPMNGDHGAESQNYLIKLQPDHESTAVGSAATYHSPGHGGKLRSCTHRQSSEHSTAGSVSFAPQHQGRRKQQRHLDDNYHSQTQQAHEQSHRDQATSRHKRHRFIHSSQTIGGHSSAQLISGINNKTIDERQSNYPADRLAWNEPVVGGQVRQETKGTHPEARQTGCGDSSMEPHRAYAAGEPTNGAAGTPGDRGRIQLEASRSGRERYEETDRSSSQQDCSLTNEPEHYYQPVGRYNLQQQQQQQHSTTSTGEPEPAMQHRRAGPRGFPARAPPLDRDNLGSTSTAGDRELSLATALDEQRLADLPSDLDEDNFEYLGDETVGGANAQYDEPFDEPSDGYDEFDHHHHRPFAHSRSSSSGGGSVLRETTNDEQPAGHGRAAGGREHYPCSKRHPGHQQVHLQAPLGQEASASASMRNNDDPVGLHQQPGRLRPSHSTHSALTQTGSGDLQT